MNYYDEIKNELIDNELTKRVKDYSKNKSDLMHYYKVGMLLVEAGNKYGDSIIEQFSNKLIIDVGKKYDRSTLFKIRKFYLVFSNEKVAPLVPQLSWSHYLILLPISEPNKINYYMRQALSRNLTKRQLYDIVKNHEYERLTNETKEKIINGETLEISDVIHNPILVKNKYNDVNISEKVLQKIILEDISSFLKELGSGFTFVDNEYKIKIGNAYNYIDILLFNINFNCYVVIELKVRELRKQDIGQIEIYMNYIDKHVKSINHEKTIGIIICKKDNKLVLEYSTDARIYSTEYILM